MSKKQNTNTKQCCGLCTCELEKILWQNVKELEKCYKEKINFFTKEIALTLQQIKSLEAKKKTAVATEKNLAKSYKTKPNKELKNRLAKVDASTKIITKSIEAANKNLVDFRECLADSNCKYKSFAPIKTTMEKSISCCQKPKTKIKPKN